MKKQRKHETEMQKERKQLEINKEQEIAVLKDIYHNDMVDAEQRARTRQDSDAKTMTELEHAVSELRDEILQANQIRKQQLVERSLLREEEKQKTQKEHEKQIAHVRSHQE